MEKFNMPYQIVDPIAIKFFSDAELETVAEEIISNGHPFEFIPDGAFVVSKEHAKNLKEKGFNFREVPIVPISSLPPEKREKLREKYLYPGLKS